MKVVLFFIIYLLSPCYAFAQDLTPEQENHIKQLEALISKVKEDSRKWPKRNFDQRKNDLATTKAYIATCSSKIEEVGNLHYPEEAKRKSIYGNVTVRFEVSSSGDIGSIGITRSSGSPILDNAALETIKLSTPCPRLPESVTQYGEKLILEKTLTFLHENEPLENERDPNQSHKSP